MTLKEALFKADKTQYWLEQQTGIPQSMISLFVNGYRTPSPEQAEKIAKAFGRILIEGISYTQPPAEP